MARVRSGRRGDSVPSPESAAGAWFFWVCVALWILLLISVSQGPPGWALRGG